MGGQTRILFGKDLSLRSTVLYWKDLFQRKRGVQASWESHSFTKPCSGRRAKIAVVPRMFVCWDYVKEEGFVHSGSCELTELKLDAY